MRQMILWCGRLICRYGPTQTPVAQQHLHGGGIEDRDHPVVFPEPNWLIRENPGIERVRVLHEGIIQRGLVERFHASL